MKLTKEQVNEKREKLCQTLIEYNKIKAKAENLKEDFEKNEKTYRGGIVTATGILYRKPRWDVTAKEKVAVPE